MNRGGVLFARRGQWAVGTAVGLTLVLSVAACSSGPPDGGGEPSNVSIHHAVYSVIGGLNDRNEKTFLGAVQSGKEAASVAWQRCEPAMLKGAKATFPGQDDPTVASVTVQVPHDDAAGCYIALYWSWSKGWSMKSWKGSQANN
jgi:hypothetical protein